MAKDRYLEQDYGIYLSPTTIMKIMALNRRVHLAPQRPVTIVEEHDPREGPKKSRSPFERIFVDFRYLDAKPGGAQLYSCTLLEGFSRVILAGSLTTDQNAGVLLHIYFQALLRWGHWEETISDHSGQFNDHDWIRVNERLGIHHEMYPKGRPWQNLIESYFGIEARHYQRLTDTRGFVRIGRWKIYIEDGLPRTPVQLSFWNGKLRAEYQSQILTEYQCKWGASTRYTREIETRIRSPNAQ